jgi:hypothetical protein
MAGTGTSTGHINTLSGSSVFSQYNGEERYGDCGGSGTKHNGGEVTNEHGDESKEWRCSWNDSTRISTRKHGVHECVPVATYSLRHVIVRYSFTVI